jgi:hypothetical protein
MTMRVLNSKQKKGSEWKRQELSLSLSVEWLIKHLHQAAWQLCNNLNRISETTLDEQFKKKEMRVAFILMEGGFEAAKSKFRLQGLSMETNHS